ncbi:MAG: hypothetical protein IPJ04_06755 [Candidatus Eisenbacteria bacterium]|nr:hypothetical protein [Candidatus Eisenbacteria bacterium]
MVASVSRSAAENVNVAVPLTKDVVPLGVSVHQRFTDRAGSPPEAASCG